MAQDALEVVKLRRNFYRDSYRIVLMALLIAILVIAGLVGVIGYMMANKAAPRYFATTSTGKLIPMVPLNQPNMSQTAIRQWTANAVTSIYTYDFLNYRKAFQDNEQYFTSGGWKAFLDKIASSRNLKAVQDEKLTVSAVPAGTPVIVSTGVLQGHYVWRIQIPMVVTYVSLSQTFNQRVMVTLTVMRLSTLDTKYGVGIAQFVEQQQ
jgi:intracellular multiplication protein IcmL